MASASLVSIRGLRLTVRTREASIAGLEDTTTHARGPFYVWTILLAQNSARSALHFGLGDTFNYNSGADFICLRYLLYHLRLLVFHVRMYVRRRAKFFREGYFLRSLLPSLFPSHYMYTV